MRLMHGPFIGLRNLMVGTVEYLVKRQLQLDTAGAMPPGRFEDIARASISLVSEEFFEKLRSGDIKLKREVEIEELLVQDSPGSPGGKMTAARLSDGSVIPAQIVACGTGFYQRVPFLDSDFVKAHCVDEKDNFLLYRFIKPVADTDTLFFIGYNSSLFCPTSFEVATLWSIGVMEGSLKLPSQEKQRAAAREELAWMAERTRGKHSHGTNVVPFSLHNIDDMLSDLNVGIGFWGTARQWLLPVKPTAYSKIATKLLSLRLQADGQGHGDPIANGNGHIKVD